MDAVLHWRPYSSAREVCPKGLRWPLSLDSGLSATDSSVRLCCPSVYLPGHCNVFSLLPSCEPQHSQANCLGWTASLPTHSLLSPRDVHFPTPYRHSTGIQLCPQSLCPYHPGPTSPSLVPPSWGKGHSSLHGWHKLSLLDSCNPIATRRCLLLPSSSPVGHALISVQRHVSKLTTPSHTSRAFLGNRTGTGLLPLFRCLKFRHFIWDGH